MRIKNARRTQRIAILALSCLLALSVAPLASAADPNTEDAAELAFVDQLNGRLRADLRNFAVHEIDYFTIGEGRPSIRIHQLGDRWVAGDERRSADGNNLTYLVDQSDGATISGLTSAQTEGALDRAINNWACENCLRKVDLVKRPDTGADPDITDSFYGFGDYGQEFAADIVYAGWLPRAFFEAASGSGCGHCVLAVTFTYIFTDDDGVPTDINGDNFLDTAFSEIYFNNTFGDPSNTRANDPWAIDAPRPAIDVVTVAMHETGHALGLGHFGPEPMALMNPRYNGINQTPDATDRAGLCAMLASWPQ